MRLTALGACGRFRGMAKPTKKKSTPKQSAKKPTAKKPVKTPAKAKPAAKAKGAVKAPTPPPREQARATPYTPKPIAGVGWPAFRYPLT